MLALVDILFFLHRNNSQRCQKSKGLAFARRGFRKVTCYFRQSWGWFRKSAFRSTASWIVLSTYPPTMHFLAGENRQLDSTLPLAKRVKLYHEAELCEDTELSLPSLSGGFPKHLGHSCPIRARAGVHTAKDWACCLLDLTAETLQPHQVLA